MWGLCGLNSANNEEKGVFTVLTAIFFIVIFGFVALVVDIGRLYVKRSQLQKAVDAAALAGVQELPESPDEAVSIAIEYAKQNGFSISSEDIQITSTTWPNGEVVANDIITVRAKVVVSYIFGRVLGLKSTVVGAKASARAASPGGFREYVMPFGVMAKEPTTTTFGYTFGELVELKTPPPGGGSGNFFFVDIDYDANGAVAIYEALRAGGVDNPVYVGDTWQTEPGINGVQVAKALSEWITCNHTFSEIVTDVDGNGIFELHNPGGENPNCHRLAIMPIIINPMFAEDDPLRYNWATVTGKKDVVIVGFALFFIEDWGGKGVTSYVNGRFVRTISPIVAEAAPYHPDFGLKVTKLIE